VPADQVIPSRAKAQTGRPPKEQKMKRQRDLVLGCAALLTLAAIHRAEAQSDKNPPETVETVYPGLASGVLTFARLAELPKGVLLRTESMKITGAKINKIIADSPQPFQEQLEKNAFFLLEREATPQLLVLVARKAVGEDGKKTERQVIDDYLKQVTAKVRVSDQEVARFYEENGQLFGGATLDAMKAPIRRHVLEEKKQQAITEHLRTLGQRLKIEVAATWVDEQAVASTDNPLDKARRSGKPSLVVFSGRSCCGPDRMLPMVESIRDGYAKRLNVVYLEARERRLLAMRYHVRSIPTLIFYDKTGKEGHRHTGQLPMAGIEASLAKIGVK